MTRPRLLDLFCGAGGAAMGYHRAGFDVVGVDINPQPRYPFEFIQADAIEYLSETLAEGFDVIHASPPCQAYSSITHTNGGQQNRESHPDLIAPTRTALRVIGLPWVMENVAGAPMADVLILCGSMFGLGLRPQRKVYLRRHRLFESSDWIWPPASCAHLGRALAVYGHPGGQSRRDGGGVAFGSTAEWRQAMDIDWMTALELAEAIPPAYTEWIGRQLLTAMEAARVMTDYFDIAEAGGLCECGVSLDRHEPLPKPRPIQSWHSQRALRVSFGTVMALTPGQLEQRQAAARGRAQQARHVNLKALRVVG